MYLNGIFQPGMTAKDYFVADIEAVEVYGSGADWTGTVTSQGGHRPTRLPPHAECGSSVASQSLSTATPFDQRVTNPGLLKNAVHTARVEAIVIWLKQ